MIKRVVGLLAVSVLLAGCAKHEGAGAAAQAIQPVAQAAMADDVVGPAAPVPGAKPGGVITMYSSSDFDHLDPAQNYMNDSQSVGQLIYRTLTAYRQSADGTMTVVGDLATTTGTPSDGGRTWTFHLRPGLRYEDGTAITAGDIAYGVARAFSPDLTSGPSYLQQWLTNRADYNADYQGPYNGGARTPPGVSTPDANTIVFHFAEPHADLPYVATMSTTAPVPRSRDTRLRYDNRPFASGPYRIKRYRRSFDLELERNPYWDAASDPIRHQYPDQIRCIFTKTSDSANRALLADRGADQTAYSFGALPPDLYPTVMRSAALRSRLLQGPTPFVLYLSINTQRVRDLAVRRALNYAIDRQGMLVVRGAYTGTPATTLLSPGVAGYRKYDAYPAGPHGNPAKARELLAGRHPRLRFAYIGTLRGQAVAEFLRLNLQRAGIAVELQSVDATQYHSLSGQRDNQFDLYINGWGADWPAASSVIPPLFDGTQIQATGNENLSYLNDPAVNRRIAQLLVDPDTAHAANGWGALDEHIMTADAPVVPLYYLQQANLTGSRVGGAYLSRSYGAISLTNIYIVPAS